MREIKFRGKRIDNGELVYGYFIGDDVIVGNIVEFNDEYFNTSFWYKVLPETVGQCTGLKDKNGKEIYEGDIFKREDCWPIYQVMFSDDHGCFCLKSSGGSPRLLFKCLQDEFSPASEILGNIWENPELLGGETNDSHSNRE